MSVPILFMASWASTSFVSSGFASAAKSTGRKLLGMPSHSGPEALTAKSGSGVVPNGCSGETNGRARHLKEN
jgi:hypothetical protein